MIKKLNDEQRKFISELRQLALDYDNKGSSMIKGVHFKAKRKDNGEWIHGDLLQACIKVFIITGSSLIGVPVKQVEATTIEVDPSSVYQLINNNWHKINWE
jgi:hypothetical protein